MNIRKKLLASCVALVLAAALTPAMAQPYPSKPIKLIVAASAGTIVDATARYFADPLAKKLNTTITVDNRAGVGGLLGIEMAAKAPADGYTLMVIGVNLLAIPWISETPVQFDPLKDFIPVAKVNGAALAFVVPATSPHKTLADLMAAMKAKPGEVTYASGGAGSTAHLCTVLLNDMTKTTAKHIPYKGNGPAVTDTAGGQVDFTCNSSAVLPLVKSGKLRALAVTSNERWPEIPEVPTVAEAGVPGFEISSWIGLWAPTGTPQAIVDKLSAEVVQLARAPEFKEFTTKQVMFLDIAEHKDFRTQVPKEAVKWKRIAQLSKGN
ncbi:MAG: tripartite tricarboxylate transporter substrate binding protein [Pseudomonadota bacterium]